MLEDAQLPTEKAQEPEEAAQHQINEMPFASPCKVSQEREHVVTIESNPASSAMSYSQNSNASYNVALSQPPAGISQRQRLQWLQEKRTTGLWVRCDECNKWRYLSHILDKHELPNEWYCHMNPDKSYANCSARQARLTVREEEDCIHAEFAAGSVVWARVNGWPWWPAMVDDCPSVEQYYWTDCFSDIPTHYHVVFFDKEEVTRSWCSAHGHLKPYLKYKVQMQNKPWDSNVYCGRMEVAMRQADDALGLPLQKRLEKYSFISRFKGNIGTPTKFSKDELKLWKKKVYVRYDVTEESSDSDSDNQAMEQAPALKTERFKKPVVVMNNTFVNAPSNSGNESVVPNSISGQVDNTEHTISISEDTKVGFPVANPESHANERDLDVQLVPSPGSDDFEF